MAFSFKNIHFDVIDGIICLQSIGNVSALKPSAFSEIQIAGGNKDNHLGVKQDNLSEKLEYVEKKENANRLEIVQKNSQIEVHTFFSAYENTNAVSVFSVIKNLSDETIVLEDVSTLKVVGFGTNPKDIYFTRFTQCHHGECQPVRHSFAEYGLYGTTGASQKKIEFSNVGSWSTKEELPQGIIENGGKFTMFQIESNHSWHYEISDKCEEFYLSIGGASINHGSWHKKLNANEEYQTVSVALAFGDDLNDVLANMTTYRRVIKGTSEVDETLPTIFNEYMHLSWDSPSEENTKKYAPTIAKMGIEYYVIDCGWHNEEDGNVIYPYVGQWKESNKRFPSGVKATADYIRSLGMKCGLWIEPEIIGVKCADMLDYYDDDCFITRFGKKVAVMNRYFLDFRNEKVRDYLTQSIDRMINEYGAEYIKLDYNEDMGVGTDKDADSFGEGLEQCANAYFSWIDEIRAKHKGVLFETCSSGGLRMDYKTLSKFSIVSTSDQTIYTKYPYIAGNILSAVLPEQAAVWSYPVDSYGEPNSEFNPTKEWVDAHIPDEQVIMNMINAMLGRIHLASHVELLNEKKQALVKEGVECFKSLSDVKKTSVPFMPIGFTKFGEKNVVSGFRNGNEIYLSAYNLDGEKELYVPIKGIKTAEIIYPKAENGVCVKALDGVLKIEFSQSVQARFVKVVIE